MATKLVVRKEGQYLVPVTSADAEELATFANGRICNATLTTKKDRSYKMHKMYWKLIELALEYWNPEGGLLSKQEKDFATGVVEFIESQGHDAESVKTIMRLYMQDLIDLRKQQIMPTYKDSEMLHKWIKEQVGLYDMIQTPDGLRKEVQSISFDSMSHERWMKYYKQAFNVVWNLVLSTVFKDQDECQAAIDKLSSMG